MSKYKNLKQDLFELRLKDKRLNTTFLKLVSMFLFQNYVLQKSITSCKAKETLDKLSRHHVFNFMTFEFFHNSFVKFDEFSELNLQ